MRQLRGRRGEAWIAEWAPSASCFSLPLKPEGRALSVKPLFLVGLPLPRCTPPPGAAGHAEDGNAARGQRAFSAALPVTPSISTSPPSCKVRISPQLLGDPRPNFEVRLFAGHASRGGRRAGLGRRNADRYLADPDSVVAGTAMSVPPVRDAQERADRGRPRAIGPLSTLTERRNGTPDCIRGRGCRPGKNARPQHKDRAERARNRKQVRPFARQSRARLRSSSSLA